MQRQPIYQATLVSLSGARKRHHGGSHLWGLSTSDHSARLRKAVIAATIGTTIKWYGFLSTAQRPN